MPSGFSRPTKSVGSDSEGVFVSAEAAAVVKVSFKYSLIPFELHSVTVFLNKNGNGITMIRPFDKGL